MSAPDTNLEKQKSRHRPALWGIGAAAVFGFAMLVTLVGYVMANGGDSDAAAVTTDPGQIATD
ncbi:MAG: hypothetical protein NXH82_12470 [Rhodobacteraceae bacterium]|nr:hypothetical protein [Paracoccaceae bacterium]